MIRLVLMPYVASQRRHDSKLTSRHQFNSLQDLKVLADPFHYQNRGIDIGGIRRPHFAARRYPLVVAHHSHDYLVQVWPIMNVKKTESGLRRFVMVIVPLLDQFIPGKSIDLSHQ
jgi:hypothetical protein